MHTTRVSILKNDTEILYIIQAQATCQSYRM